MGPGASRPGFRSTDCVAPYLSSHRTEQSAEILEKQKEPYYSLGRPFHSAENVINPPSDHLDRHRKLVDSRNHIHGLTSAPVGLRDFHSVPDFHNQVLMIKDGSKHLDRVSPQYVLATPQLLRQLVAESQDVRLHKPLLEPIIGLPGGTAGDRIREAIGLEDHSLKSTSLTPVSGRDRSVKISRKGDSVENIEHSADPSDSIAEGTRKVSKLIGPSGESRYHKSVLI